MFDDFEQFLTKINNSEDFCEGICKEHEFVKIGDEETCRKCHITQYAQPNVVYNLGSKYNNDTINNIMLHSRPCKYTKNKENSETSFCHVNKTGSSIEKDLQHFRYSDSIFNIANHYFLKTCNNRVYRGDFRKSIICACVYHAFIKNNEFIDVDHICKHFNLSWKKAAKGFKLVKLRIEETRNFVENIVDLSRGMMLRLGCNMEIISQFQKHISENKLFENTCIEISKKIKIFIAILIFNFIKEKYNCNLDRNEFCVLLDFNVFDFDKMLQNNVLKTLKL
jgi:hypothetical protein